MHVDENACDSDILQSTEIRHVCLTYLGGCLLFGPVVRQLGKGSNALLMLLVFGRIAYSHMTTSSYQSAKHSGSGGDNIVVYMRAIVPNTGCQRRLCQQNRHLHAQPRETW